MNGFRLNNMSMRNIRKDPIYQGLVLDFTLLGVITPDEFSLLTGCGLPDNLVLPNGERHIVTDGESDDKAGTESDN